jgi:hypothetical protein
MNIKLATLSIISIAAGIAVSQPANAEGARFDFAPQTYAMDSVKPHHHYPSGPLPNVTAGAMPRSSSMLGVDPIMLAKPAPQVAPIARTNVTPQISFSNPIPKIVPQLPPLQPTQLAATPFNKMFGNPNNPNQAPVVASLPAPKAQPIARQHTQGVTGRLRRPVAPVAMTGVSGRLRTPAANVANYGQGIGYTPGAFLPVQSGSGMSTSTNVSGSVLTRKRH